jgi:DNA-binding transcriptional LysR family regulator
MSHVTLGELRAFGLVAQLSSFTAAGRRLGVSQPALSMTIRQLEQKLGVTLFDRSTRMVQLSAAGKLLIPQAERLIENFDRTVGSMKEIADGRRGRVAIACPEGVAARLIAPTLAAFVEKHPDVSISVHDGDAASVSHLLHSSGVDFGITGFWEEHSEFDFEPISRDQCCLICPSLHAFSNRESISLSDLDQVPLIMLNRDAGVRRLVERAASALGMHLIVQFEVSRVSTVVEAVASGLCASILTRLSTPVKASSHLSTVSITDEGLSYPIGVITPKARELSPAAALLLNELKRSVVQQGQHNSGGRTSEVADL